MILQAFPYSDLSIHSHLIGDPDTGECVVIDPPRIIKDIKKYIDEHQLILKAILETHVHADFISGALELKHAFRTAVICCSEAGGADYVPRYADRRIKDGDSLDIGKVKIVAKHTPGHTPEHLTWLCYEEGKLLYAFTGDFLFVGGVGRPDLLGEKETPNLLKELHQSLFKRVADLPDTLRFFPSHGAGSLCGKVIGQGSSSTLGQERKHNSALLPADVNVWAANLQADAPAVPITFARNKKKNLIGVPLLETLPADTLTSTTDLGQATTSEGWILDFRDPINFGLGHIKGAVNVPPTPSMGGWLAGILPEDTPLLCILPDGSWRQRITNLIRTLGYDQPITFALWEGLVADTAPLTSLQALTAEELADKLAEPSNEVFVVDVRTPAEWNSGHIEGAHHIELFQLQQSLEQIPRDKEIVTVCRSGMRSSLTASLLQKEGYKKVSHLFGGMNAWHS